MGLGEQRRDAPLELTTAGRYQFRCRRLRTSTTLDLRLVYTASAYNTFFIVVKVYTVPRGSIWGHSGSRPGVAVRRIVLDATPDMRWSRGLRMTGHIRQIDDARGAASPRNAHCIDIPLSQPLNALAILAACPAVSVGLQRARTRRRPRRPRALAEARAHARWAFARLAPGRSGAVSLGVLGPALAFVGPTGGATTYSRHARCARAAV